MSKSKHVLLSIVTLGIYPLYIRSKAKKIANTSRDNISVSTKALININDFINDLGGDNNIATCSSTISTVKIALVDVNKISNINDLKKIYDIKGVVKSSNNITFLFGDNSKAIANEINTIIKK